MDALKLYEALDDYQKADLSYQAVLLFNNFGSGLYYYHIISLKQWIWRFMSSDMNNGKIFALIWERIMALDELNEAIRLYGSMSKLMEHINAVLEY